MSMDMQHFSNSEFDLDLIPDGDTFKVIAPGLAKSLGMRDAYRLLESIPDDEKGSTTACTPGGDQKVGFVTESGFYRAIGQRQSARIKDPATRAMVERFQSWVYGDVLPSIRRHGGYLTEQKVEEVLSDPDTIIQLATNLKEERARRAALEQQAEADAPKIDAYDSFVDATGKYGVGAVAKMLGTSQNKLFRDLRNAGVLISKGTMHNTPYQKYMHHFEVKAHSFERSNGEQGTSYTTYVQPSGIDFIRKKLGIPKEQVQLDSIGGAA